MGQNDSAMHILSAFEDKIEGDQLELALKISRLIFKKW